MMVCDIFSPHMHSHAHTHFNTRVISMMSKPGYMNFTWRCRRGGGAIPSTWRPPPAYESGTSLLTMELLSIRLLGGPTLSDVEVRIGILQSKCYVFT